MKLGIPEFARFFLALVGTLYLGLALWCSFDPVTTSEKVGFALQGDAGGSEFLTVYGGLEFGLGIAFWLPVWRRQWTLPVLTICLVLHICLVVFRSIGFWFYPDPGEMTVRLAIGEWGIVLLAGALWGWLSFLPTKRPADST